MTKKISSILKKCLIPTKEQYKKWSMIGKIGYLSGMLTIILAGIGMTKAIHEMYLDKKYSRKEITLDVLLKQNNWGQIKEVLESNKGLFNSKNDGEVFNYYYGIYLVNKLVRYTENSDPINYFNKIDNIDSKYFERAQFCKLQYYDMHCDSKECLRTRCDELIKYLDKFPYSDPMYYFITYYKIINTGAPSELRKNYNAFLNRYPFVKQKGYSPSVFYQNEGLVNLKINAQLVALLYIYNTSLFENADKEAPKKDIANFMTNVFKTSNDVEAALIGFHELYITPSLIDTMEKRVDEIKQYAQLGMDLH